MHTEPTPAIRSATAEDIPAMADLIGELFTLESDFHANSEVQKRGLELLLADPDRTGVLVAGSEDEVVGMVTVQVLISTAEGGPVGMLEDLVVGHGWRGRGVGTALLEAVEQWARQRGLLRLQLLADRGNQAGLEFYAARNWSPTQLVGLRRESV